MNTEKISVRHNFTSDERLTLAEEQSRLFNKQDELTAHLKSTSTTIKAEIESATAAIRVAATKLQARYEMRDVKCILMDNRIPGYRHVVRIDSGFVIKSRKLSHDETQMRITDKTPESYVAIACLPMFESEDGAEFIELRVFADEFEALRGLPDVSMRDIPLGIAAPAPKQQPPPPAAKKKDVDPL